MELGSEQTTIAGVQVRGRGITGQVIGGIERVGVTRGGDAADPLAEALGRVDGVETVAELTVDIATAQRGHSRSGAPAVAFDEYPTIELVGPPPTQGEPAHIAIVEEAGRYRFVLPNSTDDNSFSIPVEPPRRGSDRGVVGALGRLAIRMISVAARESATSVANLAVRKVEERMRPHRLRRFGPEDHSGPSTEPVDVEHLASGPSLLLIHGTNSMSHLGFRFDRPYVEELHRRYEGRVAAFDHPTFSFSPEHNAQQLVELIGEHRLRNVDILAHSRGGIVARTLLEDIRPESIAARSVVFVATPNGGTPLAAGEHFADLVGSTVNALTFVPDNPVTDAIVIGLEALKDFVLEPAIEILPGIEVMDPGSVKLEILNKRHRPDGVAYRAVASDFEPRSNDGVVTRARDLAMDLVFGGSPNDLVVPTRSVYTKKFNFVIGPEARLVLDSSVGIDHSSFWSERKVLTTLDTWLDPRIAVDQRPDIPAELSDPLAEIDESLRAGDTEAMAEAVDELSAEQRGAVENAVGGSLTTGGSRRGGATSRRDDVIVLPGIMGSRLAVDGHEIWANPWQLLRGRFRWLELGGSSARHVEPSGLMRQYSPLISHLSRSANVIPFAYDWRKDLRDAGRKLGEMIAERDLADRPVRIVAHSMGGLVARTFIAQHPEMWGNSSRLIQLGTPNWGSFAIPGALMGDEILMRALAIADVVNSKDELLDVIASFPGVYQLLPARDRSLGDGEQEHQQLYDRMNWREDRIRQQLLDESTDFYASIENDTLDPASATYIAGDGHRTPYRLRFDSNGDMSVGVISQGDGRVAHEFGHEPFGVPTYFSEASHGGLISDAGVLAAVDDILATGTTERLRTEPIIDRGAAERSVEWIRASLVEDALGHTVPQPRGAGDVTENDAGNAIDAALNAYLGGSAAAAGLRPLEVRVVHGSLEQARHPVAAGWYDGLPIEGALKFLDRRLGGWLELEREHGHYPKAGGEAIYVASPRGTWPVGAIVLGLGGFGELTPTRLSEAMADGTTRYALDRARKYPDGHQTIGVSAVLAGAPGTYGLGVAASLQAIVVGVARAAARLAGVVEISGLEIIEYYEGTAEQAASVLSRLADSSEAQRLGVPLVVADRLESRPGGERGVGAPGESGAPWPRVELAFSQRADEVTAGDPEPATSTLEYTALTRRAQAQSLAVEVDRRSLRQLVESAVMDRSADPQTNNTLYELLFPNQVKLELDELDNLHLLVDPTTAWIPWEVLAGRDRDGALRPLALRTGLLRQLRGSVKRSELVMPGPQGFRALVVGDPPAGKGFPRLPGARDEARLVAELLGGPGGHDVTSLVYDGATDGDRSMEVRNAFFAGPYRIVHIAAHGVFDPAGVRPAGVVIGELERLTALDFSQRSVVPDLVFLNCCHLGRIEEYSPEAWSHQRHLSDVAAGLALNLIGSGVKAVVAAGWAVDDRAANSFANTFYASMIDGQTFGDASRAARTAAEAADGGRSNTWGAYQCYGDPGFQLQGTSRSTHTVPQFVSANQLVHHIEGLGKSAGLASDSTAARRVARSLDDLWTREGDRFGNSRVVEAAGAAYAELGQFDRAVAAYRLAVENRSADVRVRTIEQLANVEARLAAIRHRDQDDATPRKTPDGPDELFERSNQHLDLAFAIGATPERHAIRGSYYKKRATTESRKSTRNKMIRLSLAEYDAAIEVAKSPVLDVYHASLAIQMASLIDDDSAATERTMDVYVEMLQRLESQLPTLDSTSGTSYERSRPIDVRATSHVLHRRLADPGVQAELVDGFCAVMDVRAPFRHRMSVIDHYRDLDLLLARHSSRSAEAEGARAIADALDQYSLPGG